MITYKIKESAEDIKEAIIEKTGHSTTFSMLGAEAVVKYNQKNLSEILAKTNVEKAKMENIEHFHPFVKDLTDEQLMTAYLYFDAKNFVDKAQAKIDEFTKQAVEWEAEMIEIKKQIPEIALLDNEKQDGENTETESKGE